MLFNWGAEDRLSVYPVIPNSRGKLVEVPRNFSLQTAQERQTLKAGSSITPKMPSWSSDGFV